MPYNKITDDILAAIKLIVGEDAVITNHNDLEKYSHDETEDLRYYPEVVVKPKSPHEVSALRPTLQCTFNTGNAKRRGYRIKRRGITCKRWFAYCHGAF